MTAITAGCDDRSPLDPLATAGADLSRATAPGLSASSVSLSEIDLSWQKSSGNVSGFEVVRSTTGVSGPYAPLGSTPATVTLYRDTGLLAGTQYCYEVRSFKTAGRNTTYSAFSPAECAATPIEPPSGTDVVPDNSTAVKVSWKDNSSTEAGFRLERQDVAAGPWTSVTTAPANATVLQLSAVAERQVCYRVIAISSIAASAPSAPDCTAPPASPTSLSAKAVDPQGIILTWVDNSTVEDGYTVSRAGPDRTWSDIATLAPNAITYRDAGVTTDVSYTYRVRATKDGGYSDYSTEAGALIATSAPAAPTGAFARYGLDTEGFGWVYFSMDWIDASSNEEGFRIESSSDGLSGWATYATTAANTPWLSQKLDAWGPPPPPACFRVFAFNGKGDSKPSTATCAELGAPSDLVAMAVGQDRIDLSWTDNARLETGYAILRWTSLDGAYSIIAELPANSTSYQDTGLASGQEYWYAVVVEHDDHAWGDTDFSNYTSATTSDASVTTLSAAASTTQRLAPPRVQQPVRRPPPIRGRKTH